MPPALNLRRPSTAVNAVLALALVGGAFWAYEALHGSGTGNAASAAVRSVPVQQGTVTKTVTADGTVASASTASASFITSGTVTAIEVSVGQVVKKGQILAKVDPTASQRGLDAAQADLDAANDSLSRAEDADSDTSTAGNAVEQARLEVDQARATVDGCTLTAPMAGTVTAVNGTIGGSSSASSSSSTSTATNTTTSSSSSSASSGFVAIDDLSKLRVTAAFAEADATGLKAKQAATVTWNALNNTSQAATVSAIDPAATTSNNVVTYGVTLNLTKIPAGAKVGQTVSVSITTGTAQNALFVNSAAVTSVGSQHTVTVLNNGEQQEALVEIGLVGDTTTQITSGLRAGQQVVVATASSTSGSGTGFGNDGGGLGGAGIGAGGAGGADGPGGGTR
jgi:macrolide-specific efflux system membrane fusion protein